MKIESKNNQQISLIRKIRDDKKYRDSKNVAWIEGIHLLQDALISQCRFISLFISESRKDYLEIKSLHQELSSLGVPVYFISKKLENSLFETQTPQGIGAVIERPIFSMKRKMTGPLLFLDQVQDPGNVGTLIRTAEAAGVEQVFILPGTADVWSGKVIRASMGSIFRVPVTIVELSDVWVRQLKSEGYSFLGAELECSIDYQKANKETLIALFLGSEGSGLSLETRKYLDTSIHIPMKGKVNSLNVAVAGSILMFHLFNEGC